MNSDKESVYEGSLADTVRTKDVVEVLSADLDASIEELLRTSAAALGSDEASVLVKRSGSGDLYFLKAIGAVSDQLVGIEIPAGKGVAGFVAASGQPMAISDAGQEEAFYAEVDKKTGYSTEILLATPLFFDGEVIGVLEYINRKGNPPYAPFSPEEMDLAAVYADTISVLVNATLAGRLTARFTQKLEDTGIKTDPGELNQFIDELRGKDEHKELLKIAVLVKEISDRGEESRTLCLEILESIARFSKKGNIAGY